jgi:hypothetical protein
MRNGQAAPNKGNQKGGEDNVIQTNPDNERYNSNKNHPHTRHRSLANRMGRNRVWEAVEMNHNSDRSKYDRCALSEISKNH